jgi:hypothetical protein
MNRFNSHKNNKNASESEKIRENQRKSEKIRENRITGDFHSFSSNDYTVGVVESPVAAGKR